MHENDISYTFTDTVRKKFIELGFPKATSGQLSKIILPFKVDQVEKKVVARCDNFFYLEQIIKPYQEEIHDIVKKCWGDNFIFEIDNNNEIIDNINPIEVSQPKSNPENKSVEQELHEEETQISKYTFKNFICGESNVDALNACQYITKNAGKFAEPLFIYGQTGVGKTHLLHAIGHELFSKNKNIRIIYVSIHDFINEVIHKGIRLGKMEDVRKKYKLCDVLLVDDMQSLEKKKVCQAEFFHIINAVLQRKKQIILTSNTAPKDFKYIDTRLKSRFLQGVILEINLPTKDDRIAIIQGKLHNIRLNISKEMVDFIASNLKTNVREIEGALNDILFKSVALKNSSKAKENIVHVLKQRLPDVSTLQAKKQNLKFLQKIVCQYFDIEISVLKSTARNKNLTLARHIAIYIAKERLQFKTCEIATAFERKHHKLVSYAVRKVNTLLNTNNEIKQHIELCMSQYEG